MAHTQDSLEDWRDKFARIFKPAPSLASIYDIEDFADDYNSPVNTCMTPSELWRSVFYHTVKRELETGDTQGRRYLHVDYLGLDVISVYEYPSARANEEELTAELAFGAVSLMSAEQLQHRLKVKLFYVPSYACTSFAIGHIMHDLFHSSKVPKPSLRKAPEGCDYPFGLTIDPMYRYMVFFRPCAATPDVSLPLSNRDCLPSESSEPVFLGQLNIIQALSGQATAQSPRTDAVTLPESCSSLATPATDAHVTDGKAILVPQRSVSLADLPSGIENSAQDEPRCLQEEEEQSNDILGDVTAYEQKNLGASVPDFGHFDEDDVDRSHNTSLSSVDSFGPRTPSSRDTFSRFSVLDSGGRSLCNFHSIFSGASGSPPRASPPRSDFTQSLDFSLLYGSTAWSGKNSTGPSREVKENVKRGFRTSAYSVPLPR